MTLLWSIEATVSLNSESGSAPVCELCVIWVKYVIIDCVCVQGVNIREKAKQLVILLKDEERLREERIHALKTKEKMAQTSSGESVS